MESIELNLGCGPVFMAGGIGVDRYVTPAVNVVADICHLPFADGSVGLARCAHILEHLPLREAVPALLEVRRVLKPGAKLLLSFPDLRAMCMRYLEIDNANGRVNLLRDLYGQQTHEGEYHRSGWDEGTARYLLATCGYKVERVGVDPDHQLSLEVEAVPA